MEIEGRKNKFYPNQKDIYLKDSNYTLKMMYGNNGDLYLEIWKNQKGQSREKKMPFSIYTSDLVYSFFYKLYESIISCEIYEPSEIELSLCSTIKERQSLLEKNAQMNKRARSSNAYSNLVNNQKITWYSDSTYDERASVLEITVQEGEIKLVITDNPDDPNFGSVIQISNSGSKYTPFDICFMNLFNELQGLLEKEKVYQKQ